MYTIINIRVTKSQKLMGQILIHVCAFTTEASGKRTNFTVNSHLPHPWLSSINRLSQKNYRNHLLAISLWFHPNNDRQTDRQTDQVESFTSSKTAALLIFSLAMSHTFRIPRAKAFRAGSSIRSGLWTYRQVKTVCAREWPSNHVICNEVHFQTNQFMNISSHLKKCTT